MIGDDGPFVVRLRAVLPHSPRGHSPVVVDADRAETPCTEAVGAYLTGLLPDSEATLERLGRRYGVSPRNPFALLRHIGRDAAGAVQVLPDGVGASDAASRRGDVEWLSDVDVRSLVGEVAAHPSDWDPRRDAGRWSLAGAQAKVALFRGRDGRWAIPRDSTPTTHVLKPAPAHLRGHHAHAKNYSVLLDGPRAVLAPLYDVASYLTYDAEPGAQSAMKIGSTWDMATVTNRDWAAVGRKLGLSEDDALGRVDRIRRQLPQTIHQVASEPGIPDDDRAHAQLLADRVAARRPTRPTTAPRVRRRAVGRDRSPWEWRHGDPAVVRQAPWQLCVAADLRDEGRRVSEICSVTVARRAHLTNGASETFSGQYQPGP